MSTTPEALATRLEAWAKDYATTDYTDEMATKAAAELRRLSAIEIELELTRQTHLSVVQRLQAEIDKLKRELEKEARYSASLRNEADERAEMDARAYNCGEL